MNKHISYQFTQNFSFIHSSKTNERPTEQTLRLLSKLTRYVPARKRCALWNRVFCRTDEPYVPKGQKTTPHDVVCTPPRASAAI